MKSFRFPVLFVLFLFTDLFTDFAVAGMIVVKSGNGEVGQTDDEITMLLGPQDHVFLDPFSAADFTSARNGPNATIIDNSNFLPPGFPTLPSDPTAKWISTDHRGGFPDEGRTALYAVDFEVTEPFGSAVLELLYVVDNYLGNGPDNGSFVGTGPNEGVFVNGFPILGSSTNNSSRQEYSLISDISPYVTIGTNTLFLNQTDVGGPSGVVFNATITTTPIPEPSSFLLTVIGILALLVYGWRWKQPLVSS